MIPEFLSKYFWDVEVSSLDVKAQGSFIIERILEKGDEQAVVWLRDTFPRDEITRVAGMSRRLSPKSRTYWGLVYHLWSTQHQSTPPREGIWQH